jgi:anti-anti-sigma factor
MAQIVDVPSARGRPGDVSVVFDDDVTLIILTGEIDLTLSHDLQDAGNDVIDRALPVQIDMQLVTSMDSAGVSFVARLVAAEHKHGARPVIHGARPMVVETLTTTGLTPQIDLT